MASGITGAASAAAMTSKTGSGTSAQEIAGNFTQFLTLLTTQLKNQNPLDPMDTNQFTQQLVQFAGVEQQLKANDRLDSILASSKAASTASATSYVGQTIESTGITADLKDGAATWTLDAARAAPRAKVTILDAKGNTVGQQDLSLNAGPQTFTWNGKNAAGISQPAGTYTIKVVGQDATGATVTVETGVSGKVSKVDLSGSEPVLIVGTARVPLSSVKGVGLSTTSG